MKPWLKALGGCFLPFFFYFVSASLLTTAVRCVGSADVECQNCQSAGPKTHDTVSSTGKTLSSTLLSFVRGCEDYFLLSCIKSWSQKPAEVAARLRGRPIKFLDYRDFGRQNLVLVFFHTHGPKITTWQWFKIFEPSIWKFMSNTSSCRGLQFLYRLYPRFQRGKVVRVGSCFDEFASQNDVSKFFKHCWPKKSFMVWLFSCMREFFKVCKFVLW